MGLVHRVARGARGHRGTTPHIARDLPGARLEWSLLDGLVCGASNLPRMTSFNPSAMQAFRFVERELDHTGAVRLTYALDDADTFVEEFDLPIEDGAQPDWGAVEPLLDLLHWVAGVSYFKTAAPPEVRCETGAPAAGHRDAARGAVLGGARGVRRTSTLCRRSRGPRSRSATRRRRARRARTRSRPRSLVPVGGGKDSIVALEIVRRSGASSRSSRWRRAADRAHRRGRRASRGCSSRAGSTRS